MKTIHGKQIKTKVVNGQEVDYYMIECLDAQTGAINMVEMQLPRLD